MRITILTIVALGAAAIALISRRLRHCHHRFGAPVSGYVRCMRCTRRFRIETDPSGEWHIARQPEHEPASSTT
jgi:hypothetical protein